MIFSHNFIYTTAAFLAAALCRAESVQIDLTEFSVVHVNPQGKYASIHHFAGKNSMANV